MSVHEPIGELVTGHRRRATRTLTLREGGGRAASDVTLSRSSRSCVIWLDLGFDARAVGMHAGARCARSASVMRRSPARRVEQRVPACRHVDVCSRALPPVSSCPVAPLEFCLLADWYLRRHGVRDAVDLTFVTPLDGAFTKPVASRELDNLLDGKGDRARHPVQHRYGRRCGPPSRELRRAGGPVRPCGRRACARRRRVRRPVSRSGRRAQLRLHREVHRFLVEEIGPHEEAEDKLLYPVLARVLGGDDPTVTMSRGHVEIAHQIRRLGHLLDDVDPSGLDGSDARREPAPYRPRGSPLDGVTGLSLCSASSHTRDHTGHRSDEDRTSPFTGPKGPRSRWPRTPSPPERGARGGARGRARA